MFSLFVFYVMVLFSLLCFVFCFLLYNRVDGLPLCMLRVREIRRL